MDDKMKERIMRMANRTWDYIGGDILVDEDGNMDESMSLPKDHVIEIVMDASHMLYMVGMKKPIRYSQNYPMRKRWLL